MVKTFLNGTYRNTRNDENEREREENKKLRRFYKRLLRLPTHSIVFHLSSFMSFKSHSYACQLFFSRCYIWLIFFCTFFYLLQKIVTWLQSDGVPLRYATQTNCSQSQSQITFMHVRFDWIIVIHFSKKWKKWWKKAEKYFYFCFVRLLLFASTYCAVHRPNK